MPCSFLCIAPQTVVVQSARSVVAIVVVVVVLEEELLGDTVAGKGDGRNAEAGEGALEAVEAGEGPCVAPLLAARGEYVACVGAVVGGGGSGGQRNVLARPRVALCAVGRSGGELLGVEAGDV
jgi:hypothetical protein